MPERPRAYSYLRFSTPEQGRGDSRRRQTQLAEEYAAKHGLNLDASLRMADEGLSAYHSENLFKGALGRFLKAIIDGDVASGSFLLVESLDRLSRQNPWDALGPFQSIINAGVTIVTLQDQRVWNREAIADNPMRMIESILIMNTAYQESVKKAHRLQAVWAAKRKGARERALTSRGPGWLRLDTSTSPPRWRKLPERVKIVKRIFTLAAAGNGQHAIAHRLNQEGVPTFGKAQHWHRSTVKKILESPAVRGTFIPHTQRREGEKKIRTPQTAIEGYYPPAIAATLFENVRAMSQRGRRQPSPKRQVPSHMLAGIARCAACGGSMTRVWKGPKNGAARLVCSRAKVKAGCVYRAVKVDKIEQAIIRNAEWLVGTVPSGDPQLDGRLEQLEVIRAAVDEELENIVDQIATRGGSEELHKRLMALERERDTRRKEEAELTTKLLSHSPPSIERRLSNLVNMLTVPGVDCQRINALLRQLVKSVAVDVDNGSLHFAWEHGGESELLFTHNWGTAE